MSRLARAISESRVYHILFRGVNQQNIFEENTDFYRSHKSCIVNTKQIYKVDYAENLITFYNNAQTDLLSVRNKRGLKEYGCFN